MALVVTLVKKHGRKMLQANRSTRVTLAGDGSYPSGGYPLATILAAADAFADQGVIHVEATEDGNYRYAWDHENGKLMFLSKTDGTEASGDVSAATAIQACIWSE